MVGSNRFLRPYPFEVTALVGMLAVLGFLAAFGLFPTWASAHYSVSAMFNLMPTTFVGGLVLAGGHHLLQRRSLRAYASSVFSLPWIILWLRFWLACWVATFAYFWLKVYVPLINPRLWDEALWRLDALLHLGVQPNTWLVNALDGHWLGRWLDIWYRLWLATIVFSIALYAATIEERLRRGVAHSCVLMWALGCWFYLAVPAHGPAFLRGELWANQGDTLPIAVATHQLLWSNYQQVVTHGADRLFNHTLGLAALPSLHVGFHWLFALWARTWSTVLFVGFAAMTLLTQLACVLTGWHYAVDGYAGMALAYLAYRVARRLEGAEEKS